VYNRRCIRVHANIRAYYAYTDTRMNKNRFVYRQHVYKVVRTEKPVTVFFYVAVTLYANFVIFSDF